MRILLTGHDGYIGRVLFPMLEAADHDVVGIDSFLYWGCGYESDAEQSERPAGRDVRDIEAKELEGIDAVVHLAGISNDPLGELNSAATFAINHVATVRLARAAKAAGVGRFVFASSCSVYGAAGDEPIDETAPANPQTAYAFSKVMAEQGLRNLADDNFSPVLLRNATAYGMSPRLRADLVVNNLTAYAHASGHVLIKSDGQSWRPLVHVQDISRAIIAGLAAPREVVHNEVFNVGATSQNYRVGDIAELVAARVAGSKITYSPTANADTRCYRVDCSKLAAVLPNAIPTWDVVAGIDELATAFDAHGLNVADIEGPRFLRIARIKEQIGRGVLDAHLRQGDGAAAAGRAAIVQTAPVDAA